MCCSCVIIITEINIESEVVQMAKAKIVITCKKCSKSFTWSKTCANRAEADATQKWALNEISECPDCVFQEKIEYENKKAKEMTEELNLPQLEGSEKQIAWANTIRVKFIEDYNSISSTPRNKRFKNTFEKIVANENSAKFWINERQTAFNNLIDAYDKKINN